MTRYIAFLRRINVGGHRQIKMTDLARLFESLGLENVRTYIASGNVLFETKETDADSITTKIEDGLKKALGYEVKVILRSMSEVEGLIALDPSRRSIRARTCACSLRSWPGNQIAPSCPTNHLKGNSRF